MAKRRRKLVNRGSVLAVVSTALVWVSPYIQEWWNQYRPEPAVAEAHRASAVIDKQYTYLRRTRSDIAELVAEAILAMDAGGASAESEAVAHFRSAARGLRRLLRRLDARYGDYVNSLERLIEELEPAPEKFRATAAICREHAEAEPFDDLAEYYLGMADTWEHLADTMTARRAMLKEELAEAPSLREYIERGILYVERFEQALTYYPDMTVGADRHEYLAQTKRQMERLKELQELFRTFSDRVRGHNGRPVPQNRSNRQRSGEEPGWRGERPTPPFARRGADTSAFESPFPKLPISDTPTHMVEVSPGRWEVVE